MEKVRKEWEEKLPHRIKLIEYLLDEEVIDKPTPQTIEDNDIETQKIKKK